MKKNLVILFVLFWYSLTINAAGANRRNLSFIDTVPQRFRLNARELCEHTFNRIPASLNTESKKADLYKYCNDIAQGVASKMESGDIYSNWMDLENYLNGILDKLKQTEELKKDPYLHVYIQRNSYFNASTSPTGIIYFNIGVFDYIKSEAEIAALLSHELSHYVLHHSITKYVVIESGKFDFNIITDFKSKQKFYIQQEMAADSLGLILAHKAGYNTTGAIKLIEILERVQGHELKKVEETDEVKEVSHPSNGKRKEHAYNIIHRFNFDSIPDSTCIQSPFLREVEELSKLENLNNLLFTNDFDECTERAFKYHIFDVDNPDYYYYILEGLRRQCYFNKELWGKNFITSQYYTTSTFDGEKGEKYLVPYSLFEKFDLDIIPIAPQDSRKIKARFYWSGDPMFKTNEEAFTYFFNIGTLKYNNPECYFSNALSLGFDTLQRNPLLRKYLSNPNIKFRNFAASLLESEHIKKIPNNILIAVSDIYYYTIHGSDKIYQRGINSDSSNIVRKIFKNSLVKDSMFQVILMSDVKYLHHSLWQKMAKMEYLSFRNIKQNSALDLSYIFPDSWEVFQYFNTRKIMFDNFFVSVRLERNTAFEYTKSVINMDPKTMYLDDKHDTYLDNYFSLFFLTTKGIRNYYNWMDGYTANNKAGVQKDLMTNLKSQFKSKAKKIATIN